ncbi:MAG: phosphopantetheine-binding protein [Paracoccaceae bacterium]|jgi:acyl carrier protein|nr:phosphopantetheine-binding protein [Paracoccaceae bacterium]|tara:strand:- start:381 stop:641 length:261 start_codon:yes stop_codon:yes gene_type:complete
MTIQDTVVEILAEKALLKPGDVKLDFSISDLGLDSLGIVEIIFALEEQFNIEIDINFNNVNSSDFDISTVQEIIKSIEKILKNKNG